MLLHIFREQVFAVTLQFESFALHETLDNYLLERLSQNVEFAAFVFDPI